MAEPIMTNVVRTMSGADALHKRMADEIDELRAERDQFKRLWDETRETAERLRLALEEIALPCAAEAVGRPIPYVVARAREALGGDQHHAD